MARRKFTREFKVSAVKLVNEQGYTIPAAAKSLGVDPNCVRGCVAKLSAEPGMAPAGEGALMAEVRQLRKDNARLLRKTRRVGFGHHKASFLRLLYSPTEYGSLTQRR